MYVVVIFEGCIRPPRRSFQLQFPELHSLSLRGQFTALGRPLLAVCLIMWQYLLKMKGESDFLIASLGERKNLRVAFWTLM